LNIQTNDTAHPRILIPRQGKGLPATGTIALTPTALDFGKVMMGKGDTLSVTVKNSGAFDITYSAALQTSLHGFSMVGNYSSLTLSPDQSAHIHVAFRP